MLRWKGPETWWDSSLRQNTQGENHCPMCYGPYSALPYFRLCPIQSYRVTSSNQIGILAKFKKKVWLKSFTPLCKWVIFISQSTWSFSELNCVNAGESCSAETPTWSKNVGSVGIFRSFIKFLLMTWKLLSLLKILDKDNFFLDMFQFKVLIPIYCFSIGCFEFKKYKLALIN